MATPMIDEATELPMGLPANPTEEQLAYARRLHEQRRQIMPADEEDGHGDAEGHWEPQHGSTRRCAALHSGADRLLLDNHHRDAGGQPQVRDITPA
jgi:hypothetical protein